ncbi:hypothetical protein BP5796_10797 [Coleophoma crateriformis]|uniref:Protein kinase domain-containing protein n=1 Tax=Coleophoma crateriformis TaxID=565419 RepID=A0A3D8QL06_9HELO|nr:hypothetical protein BP5796_10797 [Coleophoma crateriformis]
MGDSIFDESSEPSAGAIDISQSVVWTHARSISLRGTGQPEVEPDAESAANVAQNACLLFAKIASDAMLPCVGITDYDTSDPLGTGLSFDVAGMGLSPQVPWYRASLFQSNPTIAVKRIRAGRIHDEATASQLRPLLQSIILELQILTHPSIRQHENIVSCFAAGYQHFSYDNTYLLPLIVLEYTNWTTLDNHELHLQPFGISRTDQINCLVDVARALNFLHKAAITHGDVKGSNVLVYFLPSEAREIVGRERTFIAKITDFGCAHVNDGRDSRLPGLTPLWAAPEASSVIAADLIHKADIYSYGLLVCYVILDQDFSEMFELEGDRLEQVRSLNVLKRNDSLLEYAERALEKKISPKLNLNNILQVLRCTLQKDPSLRTLETIESFLQPKHGKAPKQRLQYNDTLPSKIQPLEKIDDLSLLLSTREDGILYPSKFFDCDWSTQSYIVRNLICEWESNTNSKPRRGHAALELCICYLNGFGVRSNNSKAAEYLGYAVSSQSKQAQHLFYRLQKYLSANFRPNNQTIEWLIDGMSSPGFTSHIAAQDLAAIDMERYLSTETALVSTYRISSCSVGEVLLDFTNLGSLQQAIRLLPTPHNSILTNNQEPLLHAIVACGQIDAAALILNNLNLDMNICNELGETPLIAACQAGDRRMTELLISRGAKYLSNTKAQISPLHYLVRFREEDVDEVTGLLLKAGYPVNMNIENSRSPLYWASSRRALRHVPTGLARNNLPAIKALLKHGAEIYPNGYSKGRLGGAVQRAAMMHNLEQLKVLLNATAPQDASKVGRLLHWILDNKTVTTFERILFTGPDINTTLQELIQCALRYEKDIDKLNGYGESALFFSVAKGNAQTVQNLLKTKCIAQLNAPSGRHMLQPLMLAVSLGVGDLVDTLLKAGANINSTFGKLEETCFHMCSRKSGSIEIAELLFKYTQGSTVKGDRLLDKPRKDGRSPYHLAVYQGHFKLADWYVARGANVEATLYVITWNFSVSRVLPRRRMLGDYHRCERQAQDFLLQQPLPSSYICQPVTILGSLLPYKTEHTMSRLQALLGSPTREKPAFIVSPKFGLNALHFAVAELYESFTEYRSRMDSVTRSVLADAPLAFMLQNFFSPEQVNHADKAGWTALHIAALNSNVQATALLLEAGGNPNLCTKGQWTVLDCAYVARAKWGESPTGILLKKIMPSTAHVENLAWLTIRTDRIIELLERKEAQRKQKSGFLTKMKLMTYSREWSFYTYLDATKS